MNKIRSQSGFAFLPLVIGSALLLSSIVAYTVYRSGRAPVIQIANDTATVNRIYSEYSLIRSVLIACSSAFPAGDNGTGFKPSYPAATTAALVSGLTCPGNATSIWDSSNLMYAPRVVTGYTAWTYTNNASGLQIMTTAADATKAALLTRALSKIEATASVSSLTLTITLAGP